MNENEVGVVVTQLHVTDKDMQGSPAWQAVYRIKSGDPDGDFSITTDPKTNNGILKTAKVGLATTELPQRWLPPHQHRHYPGSNLLSTPRAWITRPRADTASW